MAAERTLLGISETADRWGVSHFSIRRLIDSGALKSINVGARLMVPLVEVQRAEVHGVGVPRKVRESK